MSHESPPSWPAWVKTVSEAQRSLQEIRTQVASLQEKDGMKSAPKALKDSVAALSGQVDKLQTRIAPRFRQGQRQRPAGGESGGEGSGESQSESSQQTQEEEEPVSYDRPADRVAELVAVEYALIDPLRVILIAVCGERRVAVELVERAVKVVAARSCRHVDDAARGATVLGSIVARQDAELLDRI